MVTDRAGRIYVGSLAFRATDPDDAPKPAHLHLIDLDGSSRILADGIMLTNGLAFSPDGRTLYHADSRSGAVWRYAVAPDGGVGPREVFAGIAVSEDGAVWVAIADGGRVIVFEADGTERRRIPVPLPMVTSVCFGGDDLRHLYIVSGSRGADGDKAGTVFRIETEVAGLPVAPARVPLP
jgi:gluconolactonase